MTLDSKLCITDLAKATPSAPTSYSYSGEATQLPVALVQTTWGLVGNKVIDPRGRGLPHIP